MSRNAGEDYFDHYEKFLRRPLGAEVFEPPWGPRIQVLEFANVFRDVGVVASLGLGHYAGEVGGTLEVVFGADFQIERLANILGRSLFHVIQQRVPVRAGSVAGVIGLVDAEWVRETGKPALCFVEPMSFPDAFARTPGGRPVLQAVAITAGETALAERDGAGALFGALELAGIDPFDVLRASVA